MRRVIRNGYLICSSLLFVALLALFARGVYRMDVLTYWSAGSTYSRELRLHVVGGYISAYWSYVEFEPGRRTVPLSSNKPSFTWWSGRDADAQRLSFRDFTPLILHGRWSGHRHSRTVDAESWYDELFIDYRPLLLLTGIAPAWWLLGVRKRRRLKRLARGLCPACCYDLRATPGRCPECGASTQGIPASDSISD